MEFNYIEYSLSEAYDPSVQIIKTAVLRQKEDGKYQVYEILNGTIDDNFGDKVNKDTSTDKRKMTETSPEAGTICLKDITEY